MVCLLAHYSIVCDCSLMMAREHRLKYLFASHHLEVGIKIINSISNAGTHVLLEACRMVASIRRVINVSTDEVYGESSFGAAEGVSISPSVLTMMCILPSHRHVKLESSELIGILLNVIKFKKPYNLHLYAGLKETATLEPTNPYSAAKAGAEMMAKAYLTSYKLPVITTRGNNVSTTPLFCTTLMATAILHLKHCRCIFCQHCGFPEESQYGASVKAFSFTGWRQTQRFLDTRMSI